MSSRAQRGNSAATACQRRSFAFAQDELARDLHRYSASTEEKHLRSNRHVKAVLRLHPDESVADPLHWGHQRLGPPRARAQDEADRWLYQEIQSNAACLLRIR